ncbi:MAG: hypothetical protein AAB902_01450 [Patescibacteria group bacterium]
MKYKKHIATGALAISLLVGGSSVFATTPQDLGIKNTQSIYQKQNKNLKIKNKRKNNIVGIIATVSNAGFTVNVKNLKTKITSSVDVVTNTSTIYKKNGISATASSLSPGQKVIIVGIFDKTTNILNAKTVKIAH